MGGGVRRVTAQDLPPVSHPAWSADAQRIAFNAGSPTASDIYVINNDGSGLTQITRDARANFYPTWSPDGSRLAFSSNRDGDWDIYVMNADGSRVRQLIDSPGLDDKPQWSPDGSRIGFATTRNGSPQLLAVDPDTGAESTLLPEAVGGLNPAWSSDGSQLAFNTVTSIGFDIEVIASSGDDRRSGSRHGCFRRAATLVAGRHSAHLLLGRSRVVGRLHAPGRDRRHPIAD